MSAAAARRGPGPGAARILSGALWTAARHPSTWLTGWLLVTGAALLSVRGAVAATDAALAQHPGASATLDLALDADLERLQPDLELPILGAAAFVALAFALLGGGVLRTVGREFRYASLWGEGGRLLPRNLRTLLLGVVASALLFYGGDRLLDWVREDWLRDVDPSDAWLGLRWLSVDVGLEALAYAYGFAFLVLAFAAKLAMAQMALTDSRCATGAWLRALLQIAGHPLRTTLVVGWIAVLWLAGSHLIGMLTAWLLEVRQAPWLGLLSGQAGVLLTQWLIVAAWLAARESMAASLPAQPRDPFAQES